jgi:hypothetical protein
MLRNVDFRQAILFLLGEGRFRLITVKPPMPETTSLPQCGTAAYAGEKQREQVSRYP